MQTAQSKSRARSASALAGFIALHLGVGAIGGVATTSSVDSWYRTLIKPSFNPPNVIFAPVWTVLYVITAIAVWRIWQRQHRNRSIALKLYAVQLLCNFLWSPLFFGLKSPVLALIDMAVMVPAALACQILFFRIDRAAGWMWLPYGAWISFATLLNAAIVTLN